MKSDPFDSMATEHEPRTHTALNPEAQPPCPSRNDSLGIYIRGKPFHYEGSGRMGLSTKPLLTSASQFVLTSQMTLSGKGAAARTCGLPCRPNVLYTGRHINSLYANPATPQTLNRLPGLPGVLSMFLCQLQYLVHNVVEMVFI